MRFALLIHILPFVLTVWVMTGQAKEPIPEQEAYGSVDVSAQASTEMLPTDIYPDSRNRLPKIKREDLDEIGKKVDDLVGPSGPTGIRLYSPLLADYMNSANDYLRRKAGLDPRLVELTILIAARGMDSQYEWTSHELTARKVGLEQEIIDIIKYRKPLAGLGEKEAAIIQLGREALDRRSVSSDTFARALQLFGKQGLVNVVSLMAHYSATAILLTTFDQQLPPGQKPLLPLP